RAQTLLRNARSAEEQRRALQAIERQAILMARLVDDCLDVSRMATGKLLLANEQVDFRRVVESAIEVVTPAAEARAIAVQATLAAAPLRGDPDRLLQVAWNLLGNAIKFSRAGGRVEVSLDALAGWARLRVRDDGAGIAPDLLPRVFDLFVQAAPGW